jgi:hypothetical protein
MQFVIVLDIDTWELWKQVRGCSTACGDGCQAASQAACVCIHLPSSHSPHNRGCRCQHAAAGVMVVAVRRPPTPAGLR